MDNSLKVIEDVKLLLEIIEDQNKKFVNTNSENNILQKIDYILNKSNLLQSIESSLHDKNDEILSDINSSILKLDKIKNTIIESDDSGEKPKLWIYGCSMSNKHDYPDHSETWYTLLAKKLDYDLVIRSNMAYGINVIQRKLLTDLRDIKRGKDLVIFSPSFWHRVYIEEFEQKYRSFLPSDREWDWYKYLSDMDIIIKDNFERWITTCEILLSLNINFKTWLLDPPISDEYPYENAKRIAKFHHLIMKPPISPQVLGWMPFQKQKPEFWFDKRKGKEDHHWNKEGHKFVSEQFYNQIKNIKSAI